MVSAFGGLLLGASIGLAEAAEQLAVPALLAAAGATIGTAIGLILAGAGRDDGARSPGEPSPRTLAEQAPPAGDRAPGWYADPFGGASPRLWDGHAWTRHRWHRIGYPR